MVISASRRALLKASSFCYHDMVRLVRSESGGALCQFLNYIFVILPPSVFSSVSMQRMHYVSKKFPN